MPDRLVVLPGGKIGFAEMKKSPKEGPSKLQLAQIEFLNALGCVAEVVDTKEKIDEFIEKLEKRSI